MEQRYNQSQYSIDLGRLHDFIRQHGEAVDYRRGERLETEGGAVAGAGHTFLCKNLEIRENICTFAET